jgi:beta-glucosidase
VADGGAGWILFRAVSVAGGGRRLTVTARVAREQPGEASLELWCDHPADGQFLGSVAVPCTGDRYAWAEVSAELAVATGVRDLYVVLRGRQRLASVSVSVSVSVRGAARGPRP